MNRSLDHIDELIGKYLAGEAQDDEVAFIESWVKENDENRKYVDQFRTIFQRASTVKEFQVYDTDAAWTKLQRSLRKPEGKTVPFKTEQSSNKKIWWRVAASILLLCTVGLFLYRSLKPDISNPVVMTAATTIVTDTLPDGSDVVLNKKTKLAYSFDKKKKTHTIKLSGEAYFNVQHEANKTFVVDVEGVYVRDIGTSFNVKAYPESNTVEVVVEKGEVMFYTDQDSGVYLRENGKCVYDKTTKKFIIDQPEENVLSYKTRLFNFSNTELSKVVEDLNLVYDKKIVLAENLKACHLTVSFNNENQDEIVAIIAETLGLTVKTTEDKILLEGSGCENK